MAVDIREGSKTFGKWFGVVLSAEKKNMLYVPKGFAHGFLVLSEAAEFAYKLTDFYHPENEGGIAWNDDVIAVEWPIPPEIKIITSENANNRPLFSKEMALKPKKIL